MSKAKLLEAGGRYVGTKMKDVLKKIRHRKSAAKSKKAVAKLGLGTKSVKPYQNVASSGSGDKSAIVPVKAQTRRARVTSIQAEGAANSSIIFKSGGASGTVIATYEFGTEGLDMYIPGSGILFTEGVYLDLTTTPSVTITFT